MLHELRKRVQLSWGERDVGRSDKVVEVRFWWDDEVEVGSSLLFDWVWWLLD